MYAVHGKTFFTAFLKVNPWFTYFNIILCDLFYFRDGATVASHADVTPYSASITND